MKVLLVEDSPRLQRTLATALKRAGYAVDATGDGEDALWQASNHDYDAIILDILLPRLDGLTVLNRLRADRKQTHVLLLTAKDTVSDRVRGLRAGADDYLVKPFALDEFARVEALCRREYGNKQSSLMLGEVVIDLAGKAVLRAGSPVDLTPREFALLEYLALRRGRVVSRTEIEQYIFLGARTPDGRLGRAISLTFLPQVNDDAPIHQLWRNAQMMITQPEEDAIGSSRDSRACIIGPLHPLLSDNVSLVRSDPSQPIPRRLAHTLGRSCESDPKNHVVETAFTGKKLSSRI